jgi:hypothetical protein
MFKGEAHNEFLENFNGKKFVRWNFQQFEEFDIEVGK